MHGVISIHASQNQGVKNYVQSAAIVRQINVKEARASARVLLHSFIIKRFNRESLAAKRASISDKVMRKKAQRMKDAERVQGLADFMDELVHDIEILKCAPDFKAKHKEVVSEMKSNDKKQSNIDHDKKIENMVKAVSKTNRTIYAAEEKKMACVSLQRLEDASYSASYAPRKKVMWMLCKKDRGTQYQAQQATGGYELER